MGFTNRTGAVKIWPTKSNMWGKAPRLARQLCRNRAAECMFNSWRRSCRCAATRSWQENVLHTLQVHRLYYLLVFFPVIVFPGFATTHLSSSMCALATCSVQHFVSPGLYSNAQTIDWIKGKAEACVSGRCPFDGWQAMLMWNKSEAGFLGGNMSVPLAVKRNASRQSGETRKNLLRGTQRTLQILSSSVWEGQQLQNGRQREVSQNWMPPLHPASPLWSHQNTQFAGLRLSDCLLARNVTVNPRTLAYTLTLPTESPLLLPVDRSSVDCIAHVSWRCFARWTALLH